MQINKLLVCLINLLLWVVIIIFVLPPLLFLFLWKVTVIIIAKLFCTNLIATSPNDTYFTMDTTQRTPIVNAAQILKIKGKICIQEFRKHFYSCFLSDQQKRKSHRNFYCYLTYFGGFIFKKKADDIDLEQHILEYKVEFGINVEEWITKWFVEKPFRENSPLWEIVLLQVPRKQDSDSDEVDTILLYKNHHCLMDGYGFVHIIDTLTGNISKYMVKDEKDESLLHKLADAFFFPAVFGSYVLATLRTRDIFHPIKNPSQRKWFLSLSTLDLKTLKDIRRQANANFITVMMSLMIGSLRRLILEKIKVDEIPGNIYTAISLPWPSHPITTFTNHWSGGLFSIPFQTDDPLERLVSADKFFREFRETHKHKMIRRLLIPCTWCMPSFILRACRSLNLPYFRYSNTFASLMMSEKPYVLLQRKVENIYLPLGLTDCVPACVLFGVSTTHGDLCNLSILGNTEIVSSQEDLDRLTKVYFTIEIESLRKRLKESNGKNDFVINCE